MGTCAFVQGKDKEDKTPYLWYSLLSHVKHCFVFKDIRIEVPVELECMASPLCGKWNFDEKLEE